MFEAVEKLVVILNEGDIELYAFLHAGISEAIDRFSFVSVTFS